MPLLINNEGRVTEFIRKSFETTSYDEKWLQKILFDQPDLLTTENSERRILPICRELPLKSQNSKVFLDLFCVRDDGRPVLVECKLWRNPQARREVIGQILEYASLLQGRTFSDLEAIVAPRLNISGPNPIFQVAQSIKPDLNEKDFVDACHGYLSRGEFDLIIAGDGIRSAVSGIKELLESRGGLASRLRLVEVEVYESDQGDLLVQSTSQVKTQTVQVTRGSSGITRNQESALVDQSIIEISDEPSNWRKRSRQFWQRFIDETRLDHPDQEPPKHGGVNTVWLAFPKPASHITCYRVRSTKNIGIFLVLEDSDEGRDCYSRLLEDKKQLDDEVGRELVFKAETGWNSKPFICLETAEFDLEDITRETAQREFLGTYLNRLINALRKRLPH